MSAKLEAKIAKLTWQVDTLLNLLDELTDADDCQYDHHGNCQAHSLHSKPCPHERAKKILRNRPKEPR